ncbi:GNAT family N-acetyltransferase [Winogradskyella flava]|uniref:GNAT family N-acetyltransferase n=1 Tax=Winogradskyella flava TaxID=1884876 RepID=UPI002493276A|nr:GNAT family N-acetyltransferase [Winogradskyella flava]
MEVRHLGNINFDVIMECFLSAFENYFVKMPTDHEFYRRGWKAAGVQYDLSFGMFDEDILVGFIISAIDQRQGHLTAYNSGTGVIPEYRGQRIVKSIYDDALPKLVEHGVTKCQLEVITENEKAIKSYQGIGFKIRKHYKCFKGMVTTESDNDFILKKVNHQDMDWNTLPNQDYYSWDNQKESLAKGHFDYYQVWIKDQIQSYFIMNSESGYVAQFEVLEDSAKQWTILFSAIKSVNRNIRINNIDNRLTHKLKAVETIGLENTVDQFEMALFI